MSFGTYDPVRAAEGPLLAAGGYRVLEASTSPASITLAAGVHEIYNEGPQPAYVRIGSAVSVPSSGDPEVSGQAFVPVGATLVLALPAATAMHALVSADTAMLHCVRKVAL